MKLSFLRVIQWAGIALVLIAIVGLNFDFASEAKKTTNVSSEDPTAENLVGYWTLDDGSGTTALDSSGNANTLTMTGSPSWVTGNIGSSALDFSGSGQYLSVADPSSGVLDFVDGSDFTITGWFNRDTAAADHTIVAKKNDHTTSAGYVVWIDNNGSTDYLSAEISDGTDTYSAVGTTNLSTTGWHHFSVVWDDSNGLYIYLDGKLDGSTTSSTTSINSLANALAFRIGAESDAGVPFDGKIDDIKVYNRALSVDEVSKLAHTAVPIQPVDTGLVGHWTFDGNDIDWSNASAEIKDVSGRGNHGDASGLTTTSVTPGKLGQALSFNGTSDYVTTTNIPEVNSATYLTLSLWLKQDVTGSRGETVVGKYDGCCSGHFDFQTGHGAVGDNAMYFRFYYLNGAYTADGTHTLGTWEYWTVVFDGTQSGNANRLKIYKDGTSLSLSFEGTIETTTPADNSLPVRIAQRGDLDGTPFNGFLDDIRIYNRALSATEVADLYNMGK